MCGRHVIAFSRGYGQSETVHRLLIFLIKTQQTNNSRISLKKVSETVDIFVQVAEISSKISENEMLMKANGAVLGVVLELQRQTSNNCRSS